MKAAAPPAGAAPVAPAPAGAGQVGAAQTGAAPAGRAGERLFAALRTFRLEPAVKGAPVLEVGAGPGGVVECLLRAGAAALTSIAPGQAQLTVPARTDPRLSLLERTPFKTLAPEVAPGPFGFFVVAATVVSAPAVLRSLALRLEPGTPGVIVIKPQSDLPGHDLPAGADAESKRLRKLAFQRFKQRAIEAGFEVAARMDAPIAEGSEHLEIFTHLILRTRPAPEAVPAAPVERKHPKRGSGGKGPGKV